MTIDLGGDPRPDFWSATRILDASAARDGWFGPARIAYDDTVRALAQRIALLDAHVTGR